MVDSKGKDKDTNDIVEISLLNKDVIKFSTIFFHPFYYQEKKEDVIEALTSNGRWEWIKYDYKKQYDEYAYFHPFTRDVLFNQNDFPEQPMSFLKFKESEQGLKLRVVFKEIEKVYPVKSIQLHLFDLNVGILTIQIENIDKLKFREILQFNELVRRIAFSWKGQKEEGRLPQRVEFIGADGNSIEASVEKFNETEMIQLSPEGVVYISKVIQYLMDPLENDKINFSKKDEADLRYQTALDERMVVYSYVCFDNTVQAREIILSDEDFLAFVLVDKGPGGSFANKDMAREYLKQHGYNRWKDFGTRYGFSRYSAVVLGRDDFYTENGKEVHFFKDETFKHFETIYYEIALILYFHRVALLKFSQESASCAEVLSKSPDSIKQTDLDRVNSLRKDFLIFTNKFWFTEITNQDQGIEMFDQWEGILRNRELFEEVAYELKEINEFIERRESDKLDRKMNSIGFIGFLLLLPAIITGYFGMNFPFIANENQKISVLMDLPTFVIVSLFTGIFFIGSIIGVCRIWRKYK